MPLSVGHIGNQVHVCTIRPAEKSVHRPDQDFDDVDVLPFIEAPDIVRLGCLAFMEDEVYRPRVVLHIEPVPDILSLTVDRQRLAVTDIVDEQRDELFRELVRTVVVRAVRHYSRHPVCVMERPHEVVAPRLRCGIRAVGLVSGPLGEELIPVGMVMRRRGLSGERGIHPFRACHLEGAVNLIRGDMVETARDGSGPCTPPSVRTGHRQTPPVRLPVLFRGLEQRQGAHHIGPGECERVLYAPVHMALRGQVDDPVHTVLPQDFAHCLVVTDVCLYECVVRPVLYVLEVGQVARIGEIVEVDDPVAGIPVDEQAHHMAPDEAGAAGNKDGSSIVHGRYFKFSRFLDLAWRLRSK